MADGTFDQTGSGLYTPEADPAAAGHDSDLSDEQLVARYREQFERTVGEYPAGTVLTAFGFGVGLGAALGFALAKANQPKPIASQAELVGRRLLDSLKDLVPDSVSRVLD